MRFRPLSNFEAVINGRKAKYVAGLGYTVGPHDYELRGAVQIWLEEGRVELVEQQHGMPSSRVGGNMTLGPKPAA